MKNTQQHFANQPTLLAVNHFWQAFFMPLYPLLADICQLSLPMVKQATTPMLHIIGYQLLKKTTPSQTTTFQPLSSFLQDKKLASFDIKNTTQFHSLGDLESLKNTVFERLFDETSYSLITGYLLAKTTLPKPKIQPLLSWTTFLAIKILHDFCSQKRDSALTEKQLIQWRDYQIFALATPDTPKVLQLIDFESNIGVAQGGVYANNLANQPPMQAILKNIEDFIDKYYLTQNSTNTQNNPEKTGKLAEIDNNNDIIFTPVATKKMSFLDYLQKYWVATSIAFSGVVFATLSVVMPEKNDKKLIEPIQLNAQKTDKNEQKHYNDVAIVKVASAPEENLVDNKKDIIKNEQSTLNDTKKSDKKSDEKVNDKKSPKTDKKADDKKTNEKKSDSKKVVKKEERRENEREPKRKETEKRNEEKVKKAVKDEKNTKKTDDKKAKSDKKATEKPKKTEVKKAEPKKRETKKAEPKQAVQKTEQPPVTPPQETPSNDAN